MEENGNHELFQKNIQFLVQTIFLIRGDIVVYDNVAINATGDNDTLTNVLIAEGAEIIPLPSCSTDLNHIELVFNVMVQIFNSACNESNVRTNNDMISLLNQIIDSILINVLFYVIKNVVTIFFLMV